MRRIWAFGIFSIVLTILFVGQHIIEQQQVALEKARTDVDELVQFVTVDLARNFFGLSQVFLGVHNSLDILDKPFPRFAPNVRGYLEKIKNTNPFVTALLVIDENGEITHWSGEGKIPQVKDREYFTVHLDKSATGLYVSPPFLSRKYEEQWVFGVSQAYRSEGARLEHVIVAIVDLEYFRINYAHLKLAPEEAITLTSPAGDIYMRMPGNEALMGKKIPQIAERLSHLGKSGFMHVRSHIDGTVRGISFRQVGDYPLMAAASYNEQMALGDWRQEAMLVAMFGFAIATVFCILTLLSVRAQREQLRIQEVLQQQAITDPLTQLANRRHAVECANQEIRKAQRLETPLSFVLIDLDHFKKVNDSFGHETGDLILKRVASILSRFSRQTDMVSRFGGEEFLMILPGTEVAGAEVISQKIRRTLDEFDSESGLPNVTASFGVTQWRTSEPEFRDTLRRADKALYEAKDNGRNRVAIA
ncbi:MAG TPA: sensor domain-containing diguanylate cyclase [Geopsychrobacteraceae bacterium]|nr:sensor domain-containing diguanylate cyclase [Geopsychrobacteraceae bacterium]